MGRSRQDERGEAGPASRPYDLGRRQEEMERTRARIVSAARTLIARRRAPVFSIDAVARQAHVARTTVYHQFGSRAALLEALFDHLAERGRIRDGLARAFAQTDAHALLRDFISAFAFFWDVDRVVMRRIQAMAVLDPELATGIRARHRRRYHSATRVVERLAAARAVEARTGGARAVDTHVLVEILYALTSFETFQALAGDAPLVSVVPMVERMVMQVFGGKQAGD